MASSLFPDPLQLLRNAVTKLETELNSALTGSSKSRQVVRSLNQLSSIALGLQQLVDKAVEAHLSSRGDQELGTAAVGDRIVGLL